MHRLAATVAKVGVFRPITRLTASIAGGEAGRSGSTQRSDRDYILDLLLAHSHRGPAL